MLTLDELMWETNCITKHQKSLNRKNQNKTYTQTFCTLNNNIIQYDILIFFVEYERQWDKRKCLQFRYHRNIHILSTILDFGLSFLFFLCNSVKPWNLIGIVLSILFHFIDSDWIKLSKFFWSFFFFSFLLTSAPFSCASLAFILPCRRWRAMHTVIKNKFVFVGNIFSRYLSVFERDQRIKNDAHGTFACIFRIRNQ